MNEDIKRWKDLAHRAMDDAFEPVTGKRMNPGGPLSEQELAEFNELDKKLGNLSKKLAEIVNDFTEKIK